MSRLRLTTAAIWVIWPLTYLVVLLFQLRQDDSGLWLRLMPVFLLLLSLSACGLYFLLEWPGAKWVLRVAAAFTALYVLFGIAHSVDHGPDWVALAIPSSLVAFGIFSIAVAGRA
jgi:hypothetical protein